MKTRVSSACLCIIYKLTNIITNKPYIGRTWTSMKERFRMGRGYKNCIHIYNAIEKYGIENFRYEVLTVCHTHELVEYWERYFIDKYDSIKNGYNIKPGGPSSKQNQQTKEKTRQSMLALNIRRPEEAMKKMSDERQGAGNPMFGKKHSSSRKQDISTKLIGNTYGNKLTQKEANEIRDLASNNIYTIQEIAETYGVCSTTIKSIVNNIRYVNITTEKSTLNTDIINQVYKMIDDSISVFKIAKKLGTSRTTIRKIISQRTT
jgi:group I intron endonuclease